MSSPLMMILKWIAVLIAGDGERPSWRAALARYWRTGLKPRREDTAYWLDPRTRMDAKLDPDASAHRDDNQNWMRDDYPWAPPR